MLNGNELVWWALTARVPATKQIGTDRLNRVLAVLAMHANADGLAWPSAERVGEDLGIARRVVRDAFSALERAGLIAKAESAPGKSTVWRLVPDVAGMPAGPFRWDVAGMPADEVAGMPATSVIHSVAGMPATYLAGEVAGDLAGDPAGMPATNKNKNKNSKHANEPNAVNALTTLRDERSLPIPVDELLENAYDLGDGDPWAGYLKVKQCTEQAITGAKNPAAVLRKRLREAA